MRPLSPTEAISPAIARTKLLMFSPYRFWRTWKIGCADYMTAMGGVFVPWTVLYIPFFLVMFRASAMPRGVYYGIVAALCVLSVVFLVLYVLCSRLRFATFGMVANNEPLVAPMWRLYGPRAFPWTLFKMLLGTVLTAIVILPIVHAFRGMETWLPALQVKPGQPPDPRFASAIFAFYAAFFGLYALFGLYWWVNSLLSDFIVPSLALEGVTLREAFRRFFELVRREPGAFLGYAFLKPALAVAGTFSAMFAFYIVIFVLAIVVVLIFLLGGLLFHAAHVPAGLGVVLGCLVGIPAYAFVIAYPMGVAMGAVHVFLEAYLQYFLGGRYPALGDLLERSTRTEAVPRPLYASYPPPPAGWPPPPPQA